MNSKIIVSGTGCCLVDILYKDIDFTGDGMIPFLSKSRGDGGLAPGRLVFSEEFEAFAGIPLSTAIQRITGGRPEHAMNVGGPSIVSLIHAAQLADNTKCEVRFYGRAGKDEKGKYLLSALSSTPVILKNFELIERDTPSTIVLSDPNFDHGHGERMFINSIGAAWEYGPGSLDEEFFHSDIAVFGGTALVPGIHDHLDTLLEKVKQSGGMTIVNTVFDFRNEKLHPQKRWPLGGNDRSYKFTDLLIIDQDEALRLSGKDTSEEAIQFFLAQRLSAFIITSGSRPVSFYSNGSVFQPVTLSHLPVSRMVLEELKLNKSGDTTGCGDNFVGGVLASVINQLYAGTSRPDLVEAVRWGIVSGGFACFYMGGTYFEEYPGQKLERLRPYYEEYLRE